MIARHTCRRLIVILTLTKNKRIVHVMYNNGYTPPILTTDSVVFQLENGRLSVLLIRRAAEPFKGSWALPGSYIAAGETTTDAMHRTLKAKAGVERTSLVFTEQLYTFDTVARDPRGHAVSVTYMALGRTITPAAVPSSQSPQFFALDELPELAYDHADIISYALERLRTKLDHTNIMYTLMPDRFTFTELQSAYEAVLGHPLDKRNFRKKIQALELLAETDEMKREGAHRPARLYEFAQHTLRRHTTDFDS